MKKTLTVSALSAMLAFSVACGDDEGGQDNPDAMVRIDAEPVPDADLTAFPALGTQLDRMGRSAVATALIGTFDLADNARNTAKNSYSQDANVAGWVAAYTDAMEPNLGILDALNADEVDTAQDGCGDQIAFDNTATGTDKYAVAGVLADDRLLIDGSQTDCDQYLAVEANLVLNLGLADCGGRSPVVDSVSRTYGVLVSTGTLDISSGVTADDATHTDDTFPYLAAPL